jgi:superfamily II DNA or RNA helicase
LRECGVVDCYRSDDIVADFIEPCLSVASRYDRAVGCFTSTSLALAAIGVSQLVETNSRIRLIASPHLTEEDIEQIELGYEYRKVIERALLREIGPHVKESATLLHRIGLLGTLIGQDILDIRIAVVRREGQLTLYHEKIGVFTDRAGNQVAFSGPSNEMENAFIGDVESVEVFRSWEPSDARRVQRLARDFCQLWDGDMPYLEIFDFPTPGKERMLELARPTRAKAVDSGAATRSFRLPRLPSNLMLRDYQRDAIRAWFAANGLGIFKMATGTGKTITALGAVTKLAEVYDKEDKPLLAVVVAPQLHLVDQWARTAKSFGIWPLCCYENTKTWIDSAHALISGLAARANGFAMMICTNATLTRPTFQQILQQYQGSFVVIADEAHNLGAASTLATLPSGASHRLALSATPERWFDPVGTAALRTYFGETLIDLGLREAIKIGALCKYDYRPTLVKLDSDESQQYAALSQRIARLMGLGESDPDPGDNEELAMLLLRRAQLLSHARGKLPALAAEVQARRDLDWQLVYCAEGIAPQAAGQGERQLDQVTRILGRDLGIPCHPYTSTESRSERRQILERFRSTDLKALVSMRCLDEGVDVPDARVAYLLASSSNPRQFIQRRGRILRQTEGKEVAEIVDFIAVPTGDIDIKLERRLLRREMARFVEFASCARNAGEALAIMRPIRMTYGLMDV